MSDGQLAVEQTRDMFLYVAQRMVESKDELTQADKAIGDGDHGVGMARGFEAVQKKLQDQDFGDLAALLKAIGMALLTSVGGAAGAMFGTLFRGAAKSLAGQQVFDAQALALMLRDGLQAVQERGKAQVGDKTMVDALAPAVERAQAHLGDELGVSLAGVVDAARAGMESTKNMVAAVGKAKPLGERSLGHADPGAVSTYLILRYMLDHLAPVAGESR
jgi:dihydroxyacetone kinase-like protein